MKFNYQVRTKEGEIQAGLVEASSKEAALLLLQKHGFYVTYLERLKIPFYAAKLKIFSGISPKDIVLFSRQLAIMFESKVPMIESLRVLANQIKNLEFQEMLFDLAEEVEGGSSFSQALSRHPKIFSPFYISMIKAGEAAGKLDHSLKYLAEYLEREYRLSAKVKGAMIYPSFVVLAVFFVLFAMVFFIIPNLKTVIMESGAEIPKITLLIIKAADALKKFGFFIVAAVFLLLLLAFRFYKSEKGKNLSDRAFIRMPLIGPLLKTIYLSRFAENLSTLISGGLMITQALELSADVVGNYTYQKAIFSARDEVKKGSPISAILALFPEIFPPIFIQMIMVGEKTGTLDTSLISIADFYRQEAERSIENLITVLEPAFILFLGLIVGGLMFFLLMPLYSMI